MLLNYTSYANPASLKLCLQYIRTFALAQGWSSTYYKVDDSYISSVWTGAGTSDHLELTSNGYGSQSMIFRFEAEGTGTDPLSEWFYYSGINPNYPSLAGSTRPVYQNNYNHIYESYSSMKPGPTDKLWIFGDDKRIIAVLQMEDRLVWSLFFGSFDIYDTGRTDSYGISCSYKATSTYNKWYQLFGNNSLENSYLSGALITRRTYNWLWMEGVARVMSTTASNTGNIMSNCYPSNDDSDPLVVAGVFDTTANLLESSNIPWSSERFLIKSRLWHYVANDQSRRPLGRLPIYFLLGKGLSTGHILDQNGKQYVCFPQQRYDAKVWFAIRIL